MKASLAAVALAASAISSADAGFVGFVASVRTVGAYTVIDVFAGVSNPGDRFVSIDGLNASTTLAGGFVQAAGTASKGWRPATSVPWQTRNSLDSFMTAGTFSGGAYAGEFFASANTSADANFTSVAGAWAGTAGSAPATTVPANVGWFTSDAASVDNQAESLAGLVGRVDASGASGAQWGIWVSHLVVQGTGYIGGLTTPNNVFYGGFGTVRDANTGQDSRGYSQFIPAPGALALLVGAAGFRSRRRH